MSQFWFPIQNKRNRRWVVVDLFVNQESPFVRYRVFVSIINVPPCTAAHNVCGEKRARFSRLDNMSVSVKVLFLSVLHPVDQIEAFSLQRASNLADSIALS